MLNLVNLHAKEQTVARLLPGILVAALLLSASSASAQAYRCGKTYQDTPCTSESGKRVIGTGGTGNNSSDEDFASDTPGVPKSSCTKRASDAQKIVWARDAGTTEQALLEKTKNSAERKLISQVYGMRGNVGDVMAQVEQSCSEEQGYAVNPQRVIKPSQAEAQALRDWAEIMARLRKAYEKPDAKTAQCDQWRTQIENIWKTQSKGGTASKTADKQRDEALASMKSLGCKG